MIDLEDFLLSAESLEDINPNLEALPKSDGMLVWHALTFTEAWLKNYLLDAPQSEVANLKQIQPLIKDSQQSTRAALTLYPKLLGCAETWLKQAELDEVNISKAQTLLKSVNYLLKALAYDCKQISWPLSNWVPANLYTEINHLLTLSQTKFEQLQQATVAAESSTVSQAQPHFEKLKQYIDNGLIRLSQKTSAISEKKTAHLFLIEQFKKLSKCLTNESVQPSLELFWQHYSDTEHFNQLLEVLLLSPSEKTAWLHTYQYYRTDKAKPQGVLNKLSGGFSSLYNSASYSMRGTAITPAVLRQKLYQAMAVLYQQVIDKRLQTEDKQLWLTQLETTVKNSEVNPVLHELLDIRQALDTSPNLSIKMANFQSQQQLLEKKVAFTDQIRTKDVYLLRLQLNQLFSEVCQLRTKLLLKQQEAQGFIALLNRLRRLSTEADFKLTDINSLELVELVDNIEAELYQNLKSQLPEQFTTQEPGSLLLFYKQSEQELGRRAQSILGLLRNFNQQGEELRQQALQELSRFMEAQQGFWERIFRFFSSNYRHCVLNIEASLRSSKSSLDKVNEINSLLSTTSQSCFYFSNQRLQTIAASNRYGLFQAPTEPSDFTSPEQEFERVNAGQANTANF